MNMNGKCGVFAAVPDLKVGFLISNSQPGPFSGTACFFVKEIFITDHNLSLSFKLLSLRPR